ncbi:MAG: hypothetical protein AAF471_05795, partial [Myxococcota bacterium]
QPCWISMVVSFSFSFLLRLYYTTNNDANQLKTSNSALVPQNVLDGPIKANELSRHHGLPSGCILPEKGTAAPADKTTILHYFWGCPS